MNHCENCIRHEIIQSSSIRENVIRDPESADLVLHMVMTGKNVLTTDWHFKSFRKMLEKILYESDYFEGYRTKNSNEVLNFLSGFVFEKNESSNAGDYKSQSFLIDLWIEELLRFLAMKVLLDSEPLSQRSFENEDGDEDDSYVKVGQSRPSTKVIMQLSPSKPIQDAWRALLLLPLTYANVCKAMGSTAVLDYTENDTCFDFSSITSPFRGDLDRKMWKAECYQWTQDSYAYLYNGIPSPIFWPTMNLEGSSGVLLEREKMNERGWTKAIKHISSTLTILNNSVLANAKNPCAGYGISGYRDATIPL